MINRQDRDILLYLLKKGKAKSAYQIANEYANISNLNRYSSGLRDLIKKRVVIKKDEHYYLNSKRFPFIDQPHFSNIIIAKPELIDIVFRKKKMDFTDWFLIITQMGDDMNKIIDPEKHNEVIDALNNSSKK